MIFELAADSMESNAYVVSAEATAVIDPGITLQRFSEHSREYNTSTQSLINTHAHFDHVGANEGILGLGEVEAICHGFAADALESGDDSIQLAGVFGKDPVRHEVARRVKDGDIIDLGGLVLEVIYTPGHSQGSICLYEPASKSLFSGDTVFVGSIGRSDLKSGNIKELERSVERLVNLVNERGVYMLYPGHGPTGTGEDILKVQKMFF